MQSFSVPNRFPDGSGQRKGDFIKVSGKAVYRWSAVWNAFRGPDLINFFVSLS
jgi:hypothetical protein